jgi:hypothetical protein
MNLNKINDDQALFNSNAISKLVLLFLLEQQDPTLNTS